MTANTKGIILVKADRINDRIDKFTEHFLNLEQIRESETITKEDFKEYVASMHVIVSTELTEKGVERKWNRLYKNKGTESTCYSQETMKKRTHALKMLKMNLFGKK